MTTRIYFNRVGPVLLNKIESEIRAVYNEIDGIANDQANNRIGIDFIIVPSAQIQTQLQSIIVAHDATDYEEQEKITDFASLQQMAAAALTQILNNYNDNQADITALAAATTLAQVKPIVTRMLNREASSLTREDKIVRVLKHLVRQ